MGSDQPRRAVIFDLDGTLVDTVLDLAAALNQTLTELGLPPHPPDAVRAMVGGGLGKLLERGLAAHGARLEGEERELAFARLVERYAANPASLSRLYPGAANALEVLREAGVACGLCTNKPDAIARDLLQALGVDGAFGCIVGGDSGLPKKPDPTGLNQVMEKLGAAPYTSVMVGDSGTDVDTARAAGLLGVILVTYGYTSTPARDLGADMVIDDLADLPGALARLPHGASTRK